MNYTFHYGLFAVRHCKTQYNVEHRISGQSDSPIIDYSTDVSNLDKEIVRHLGLVVITSPAPRCIHTVEMIIKQFTGKITIQSDARLLERRMGIWEGELKASTIEHNLCGVKNGYFDPYFTPPNGESIISCMKRINAFLIDLGHHQWDSPVLICGHNQTLKLLKFQINRLHNLQDYWGTESFANGKIERLFNAQ